MLRIFNWPFSKRYRVRCPDGTIKTLHKNVDEVFPLYIPGWKGDMKADIKAMEQATANVSAAYESKIQGLLFNLDDRNQSLMLTFRTIYIAFISDPCSKSGFFERQLEKLIDEQKRLSELKIQIYTLIELAKNQPKNKSEILSLFQHIVGRIGGEATGDAAKLEIIEIRTIAKKWARSNDNDS